MEVTKQKWRQPEMWWVMKSVGQLARAGRGVSVSEHMMMKMSFCPFVGTAVKTFSNCISPLRFPFTFSLPQCSLLYFRSIPKPSTPRSRTVRTSCCAKPSQNGSCMCLVYKVMLKNSGGRRWLMMFHVRGFGSDSVGWGPRYRQKN